MPSIDYRTVLKIIALSAQQEWIWGTGVKQYVQNWVEIYKPEIRRGSHIFLLVLKFKSPFAYFLINTDEYGAGVYLYSSSIPIPWKINDQSGHVVPPNSDVASESLS